jgi:hypothetical protein
VLMRPHQVATRSRRRHTSATAARSPVRGAHVLFAGVSDAFPGHYKEFCPTLGDPTFDKEIRLVRPASAPAPRTPLTPSRFTRHSPRASRATFCARSSPPPRRAPCACRAAALPSWSPTSKPPSNPRTAPLTRPVPGPDSAPPAWLRRPRGCWMCRSTCAAGCAGSCCATR